MPQVITQPMTVLVGLLGSDVVSFSGVAVIGHIQLFQFKWDSTVKPWSLHVIRQLLNHHWVMTESNDRVTRRQDLS